MSDQPPQAPIPVVPLGYGTPVQSGRPGLVTTIGVMSIIIGTLSVLCSFGLGIYSVIFFMIGKSNAVAGARGPVRATVVMTTPANQDDSDALDAGARETVVAGLTRSTGPLSAPRQGMLDRLLAAHGRQIFKTPPRDLTQQAVAVSVSSSGRLPGTGGKSGADYFEVGEGRIEVYDDHAVFFPSNGQAALRVDTTAGSETGQQNALTPMEVQQLVARASQLSANSLNQAQVATLTAELSKPDQQMILPKSGSIVGQLYRVVPDANGNITISAIGGGVTIGPDGTVVSSWQGLNTAAVMPTFKVNGYAAALVGIESLLSIALAIYLFVIGILVLRNSQKGRRLHYWYAGWKIPLSLLSAGANAWLWSSFAQGLPGAQATPASIVLGVWMGLFSGFGVAYAIGLLFALRAKTVVAYYSSVHS